MLKLRFALFAAAAAVVLGTASAMAMQESTSGADPDSHGDAVSSAARTTCPHGPNGVHGQCVSAIASAKGQAQRDAGRSSSVAACKTAERAALGSKPDKATKTAAHTAFQQCIAATVTRSDDSDTEDSAGASGATDETEASEAS